MAQDNNLYKADSPSTKAESVTNNESVNSTYQKSPAGDPDYTTVARSLFEDFKKDLQIKFDNLTKNQYQVVGFLSLFIGFSSYIAIEIKLLQAVDNFSSFLGLSCILIASLMLLVMYGYLKVFPYIFGIDTNIELVSRGFKIWLILIFIIGIISGSIGIYIGDKNTQQSNELHNKIEELERRIDVMNSQFEMLLKQDKNQTLVIPYRGR